MRFLHNILITEFNFMETDKNKIELVELLCKNKEEIKELENLARNPDVNENDIYDFNYRYLRSKLTCVIQNLMEKNRMSVDQLANKTGYSKLFLVDLLNEKSSISLQNLARLGYALGAVPDINFHEITK